MCRLAGAGIQMQLWAVGERTKHSLQYYGLRLPVNILLISHFIIGPQSVAGVGGYRVVHGVGMKWYHQVLVVHI